ncbi:MAG: hypothetical protein LC687_04555 [Actinobacteria bacterium]|nr:hypothetical protein [Actinomycetota bacterium]
MGAADPPTTSSTRRTSHRPKAMAEAMKRGRPSSHQPGSWTPRQQATAAAIPAVVEAEMVQASHFPPMSSPREMPAVSSTSRVRRARSPGSESARGPVSSDTARMAMSRDRPGRASGFSKRFTSSCTGPSMVSRAARIAGEMSSATTTTGFSPRISKGE